jgi:hypothetical protein
MKIVASSSDKVSCYFFEQVEHKTSDRIVVLRAHEIIKIKLREKIVHSTSATIFRNGNLCIRMIHTPDSIGQNYTINDFLDPLSAAVNDPNFELFKTSMFLCPNVPGVNVPIGIAHIATACGNSIVGTIHRWYAQSLEDYIEDQTADGIFNAPESILIIEKIANILWDIQAAGYIHSDIKAGNILLDDNLEPVISDIDSFIPLGCLGECIGTAGHMSPEMMNCSHLGPETDTYAMAQLIYDILIDRPEGLYDYKKIKRSGYNIQGIVDQTEHALDSLKHIIINRPSGKDADEKHFGVAAKCIYKIITHRAHDIRPLVAQLKSDISAIYGAQN